MSALELFRGSERLIVALGGVATIVLGGLLLKWGIFVPSNFTASGEGNRIGKFNVNFNNATPGALFALFGAFVLTYCLLAPAKSATDYDSEGHVKRTEWQYADQVQAMEFLDKISKLEQKDLGSLDAIRTEAAALKAKLAAEKKP